MKIKQFLIEELESSISLLKQYKKELNDILNLDGLARFMCLEERCYASSLLREHIKNLEKDVEKMTAELKEMDEKVE